MSQLHVVATPIGNVQDISFRAQKLLTTVDIIACEDTRHTRKLLNLLEVGAKKLVAYHEHNERASSTYLLQMILQEGKSVALVTDAGTPCISDPGYRLIREAHAQGIRVTPLPGPCAVSALMSISGLPNARWMFIGFLPHKSLARKAEIESWLQMAPQTTIVFYESPQRIQDTLEFVKEIHPQARLCLGRELTKLHEEIVVGTPAEVFQTLRARAVIKGEICVALSPHKDDASLNPPSVECLRQEAQSIATQNPTHSKKEVAAQLAAKYGLKKKDVYNMLCQDSR
ncbi:MAG: 16S rRNA (cytidine(1402)-2'-O)-methyltransferase [Zetaproteobacteria bacterium]|nr:16S rRNA (cytidine(1402)-2'-O)-methyltransferase [Zetaproteobacteria bacterium]